MNTDDIYYPEIKNTVKTLTERIKYVAERVGRKPETIQLMAVSKFHPIEAIIAAYRTGIRLFGESRVQEAEEKFLDFGLEGANLHLIGHLQRNKAKKACSLFSCIQSVDSISILEELGKRSEEAGKNLDILLELHTAEDSKNGFPDAESIFYAIEKALVYPSLHIRGLMTMAPYVNDEAIIRNSFRACRLVFEKAGEQLNNDNFNILSMGMTNDYEIAIEEGSTLLRIGSAIFGTRS